MFLRLEGPALSGPSSFPADACLPCRHRQAEVGPPGYISFPIFVSILVPILAEYSGRGGFMGFIAGCCFGIRTGAAYNEGKDIHWREWVMFIPFVNIVFTIMNGIEGMQGVTTSELAQQYGSSFY
jgi:hypothetical protein